MFRGTLWHGMPPAGPASPLQRVAHRTPVSARARIAPLPVQPPRPPALTAPPVAPRWPCRRRGRASRRHPRARARPPTLATRSGSTRSPCGLDSAGGAQRRIETEPHSAGAVPITPGEVLCRPRSHGPPVHDRERRMAERAATAEPTSAVIRAPQGLRRGSKRRSTPGRCAGHRRCVRRATQGERSPCVGGRDGTCRAPQARAADRGCHRLAKAPPGLSLGHPRRCRPPPHARGRTPPAHTPHGASPPSFEPISRVPPGLDDAAHPPRWSAYRSPAERAEPALRCRGPHPVVSFAAAASASCDAPATGTTSPSSRVHTGVPRRPARCAAVADRSTRPPSSQIAPARYRHRLAQSPHHPVVHIRA